jgi:hypothetical protein
MVDTTSPLPSDKVSLLNYAHGTRLFAAEQEAEITRLRAELAQARKWSRAWKNAAWYWCAIYSLGSNVFSARAADKASARLSKCLRAAQAGEAETR